jgi:hypothetical protein
MKHKYFIIFLILFSGIAVAGGFKKAPLPHYTETLGYGWSTEVPVDSPDAVWHILKEWRESDLRYIFIDKTKDGGCNIVCTFQEFGVDEETGEMQYTRQMDVECGVMEWYIKGFLESKLKV